MLFGSQSRSTEAPARADQWSDIDIHLIVRLPQSLEERDWNEIFPEFNLCLRVSRPATGGVRKLTLIFDEGEVDLIIVPFVKAYLARLALGIGLYPRILSLKRALDLFSTILHGGYIFLKGEHSWGNFYSTVSKLPGFRLSETEAIILATTSLCDLLGFFKKLRRGELIAAQRILHNSLVENNIILLHEVRTRRQTVSFQQARRVEILATAPQIGHVSASAKLNTRDLSDAAWNALDGLKSLMQEISPTWTVPSGVQGILETYRAPLTAPDALE
ncbi:hypothetical protein [Horticoccus sp. 23ND18S-11]